MGRTKTTAARTVTPASLSGLGKMTRVSARSLNLVNLQETRLIYALMGFSILVHLFFLILNKNIFLSAPKSLYEEFSVEADILIDSKIGMIDKTSLPNSEQSDDAKINDRMLPQLPKQFAIQDESKDKSTEAAESDQVTKKELTDEQIKEGKDDVVSPKKDEAANQLKMQDALRRLAIEKLREQEKIAKKNEADAKDDPSLKNATASTKNVQAGGEGLNFSSGGKIYRGKLRGHIGRFWALPEAYNMKNVDLVVTIAAVVDGQGNVTGLGIRKSSGDKVFDEMAFKAVKDAVPFPKPPEELAGTEILLNFTPRSF